MSQYGFYPPVGSSGGSGSNASVGLNNTPAPGSSTLVAGKDPSNNLVPMSVSSAGVLNVAFSGTVVTSNDSIAPSFGTPPASTTQVGGVSNSGVLVPLLFDNSNRLVVTIGAQTATLATSGNQTTGNSSLASINSKTPSLGQAAMAASVPVVIASDQTAIPISGTVAVSNFPASQPVVVGGKAAADKARHDYSSGTVTTAAYTTLIASTAAAASEIFIFDSSGQTLVLAFGAAASEVDKIYIVPGGNGTVALSIPAGTRLSIKAVSANASVGEITVNLLG